MHSEQRATTFEKRANSDEAGPWMSFGLSDDEFEEDDVARTDHPLAVGGPGPDRRGPEEDDPEEDDPAQTDHLMPGATN